MLKLSQHLSAAVCQISLNAVVVVVVVVPELR